MRRILREGYQPEQYQSWTRENANAQLANSEWIKDRREQRGQTLAPLEIPGIEECVRREAAV